MDVMKSDILNDLLGKQLFEIIVQPQNENGTYTIKSGDFQAREIVNENNVTCIIYETNCFENTCLTATIKLERNGLEVTGSIEVYTKGPCLVRQVRFPYIEWDNVEYFDSLLMSSPWGDNIQRPVKTIKSYCMGKSGYWIYDYIQCAEDEVIYTYPSILSMQYMVLHNKARSLYIASYSTGDETLTFNAKILGKTGLALSVNHYPFLTDGKWESPECGFALLEGDWHVAADLYASRMRKVFTAPDLPAWMKDDVRGWNGWVEIMMRLEGKEPVFRYRDLPEIFKRIKGSGIDTLQVAGWAYDGFDTKYPDYDHDPALGTSEELRLALDEIKGMGGRVILYTNGRLVDPESRFYKSGGHASVCVKEDGTAYVETYNTSANFRLACPSCDDYRTYLAGQVCKIITEYGPGSIQIDQISCNNGVFCFDKNHPHPTPATNFLPGVEEELKAVRRVHKELDPEFFVWCEGCHERFGMYYDVNQGHGEEFTWQIGESLPEQFLYTYPDRIVTGLVRCIQQLCYTYVQGKPFDVSYEACADEEFFNLLKAFVAVRKSNPAYFLKGVFCDNVGLEVSEGVRAFGIKRNDDRGLLVNLWLPGAHADTQCRAFMKDPRPDCSIRTVFPGVTEVKRIGGYVEIEWKGAVASFAFEE